MDAKKDLPKELQDAMKGNSIHVNYLQEEDKYSKAKFSQVYRGYDFLENLFVVRIYIQKKYEINQYTLELLLALMGLKVFSRPMFAKIPKSFSVHQWKSFYKKGYINLVMDHESSEQRLYCLNTKGRNIVIALYEYLSGEKKIPESSKYNPMANKATQVPYDVKKLELIKRLNQMEVPEHKKFLYR